MIYFLSQSVAYIDHRKKLKTDATKNINLLIQQAVDKYITFSILKASEVIRLSLACIKRSRCIYNRKY